MRLAELSDGDAVEVAIYLKSRRVFDSREILEVLINLLGKVGALEDQLEAALERLEKLEERKR